MKRTCLESTLVAALLFFAIAIADRNFSIAGEIYRCTSGDKTILTDKPCDEKAAPLGPSQLISAQPISLSSQGAHRFYGKWHGPVEFRASVAGVAVAGARSFVQASFTIDDDGNVKGSASGTGCRFQGTATWDELLQAHSLEVNASECKVAELNKRYLGRMSMPPAGPPATLVLSAIYYVGQPASAALSEVRATLHR